MDSTKHNCWSGSAEGILQHGILSVIPELVCRTCGSTWTLQEVHSNEDRPYATWGNPGYTVYYRLRNEGETDSGLVAKLQGRPFFDDRFLIRVRVPANFLWYGHGSIPHGYLRMSPSLESQDEDGRDERDKGTILKSPRCNYAGLDSEESSS